MQSNILDNFIETNPKESLKILIIVLFLIWQTIPAVSGIICYLLLKKIEVKTFVSFVSGVLLLLLQIIILKLSLSEYLRYGLRENIHFWKTILNSHSLHYSHWLDFICVPFVTAAFLDITNLIPDNPHKIVIKQLQHGVEYKKNELSEGKLNIRLQRLDDMHFDGVLLGLSKYTGNPLVIPDKNINQVVLVLGTTGAGKTITLRRFYKRAILNNYPLIIIDGKPDSTNIEWIKTLAEKYNRKFIGFNCGNFLPYDPLANGGFTELKDKIICLKDEWSSDYYRSIAEDYLQTTLEVLSRSKQSLDLYTVVDCLNYETLGMLVRDTKDIELKKKVDNLAQYNRQDITGLQAHLNILINSELGKFFEKNNSTFTLQEAIKDNSIVYFALPALRFPSFSKVLGKLVINDLKAVIDRNLDGEQKIFTVFDEFSVFAGDQVLNLVNMGRGKGIHAIFGTQGLADLEKVDPAFKNQILNCVNTLICHRLNDQESAESVSKWIGTKDVYTVTAQLNNKEPDSGMGSVRINKEFIIHPDDIKQNLKVGEAFYVSKVNRFIQNKIKIKFA